MGIMSFDIILYGFASFLIFLIIHIGIWRIKIPTNDILALFVIFLVIPSILFFTGVIVMKNVISGTILVKALLLHVVLSLLYIGSYPLAQAVSPSFNILLTVGSSDRKKMTREDIINRCGNIKIVEDRVDDLIAYKWVSVKDGRLRLTPVIKFIIISICIVYRRMLGLPTGKG